MTKKKSRTRKDMVESLSKEEQDKALREMTFPYPLAEAFDGDVVFDEMRRREPKLIERLSGKKVRDHSDDVLDLAKRVDNPEGHQKELLDKVVKQAAVKLLMEMLEGEDEEANVPDPKVMHTLIGTAREQLSPTQREIAKMIKGKERKK